MVGGCVYGGVCEYGMCVGGDMVMYILVLPRLGHQ